MSAGASAADGPLTDAVARGIVCALRPATVLAIGEERGALIEALRRRGVAAFGPESPAASGEVVPAASPPHRAVGLVPDALRERYDLIVWLDLAGQVSPSQAAPTIADLCRCADDILVVPPPTWLDALEDVGELRGDWAVAFALQGYGHDVEFGATFPVPGTMRFRKGRASLASVVAAYERRLWRLAREARLRREHGIEQQAELVALAAGRPVSPGDELRAELAEALRRLAEAQGARARVARQLQEVLESRSWRLMQRVQRVRLRLIPRGSRREWGLNALMRAAGAGRRHGVRGTFRLLRGAIAWERLSWGRGAGPRRQGARLAAPEPIQAPPPLERRTIPVDIVVCVHDALPDVQACLEAVVRYTAPPYRLVLVDDGSSRETYEALRTFAEAQDATLLRNPEVRGYTRAANQGLAATQTPYVVLLNSDTLVTPRWLDRLVACAESDPRIGLVGPLSNTASWQSIPELFDTAGEWAANRLPPGVAPADMAARIARYAGRVYPRLPFLNGFCLLLRRAMLDEIGVFDEATFGEGYGEENDLCLRAQQAGWQLAVADDAYVYHAQSRSYSHERRRQLSRRADERLLAKHDHAVVMEGVETCRGDRVMEGVRARARALALRERLVAAAQRGWEGRRVLFLLPLTAPTGGGHVVLQEAAAMRRFGVDARLLNLTSQRSAFEASHPDNVIPVAYIETPEEARELFPRYDAVVATAYYTVPWLGVEPRPGPRPARAYYIQDFEPFFFPVESAAHREARTSYAAYPDLVRFTKTAWNARVVEAHSGVAASVVGPSVDIDLFRPRRRSVRPESVVRIAAMVRPSTPRRAARLTMEVLREVDRRHGGAVEIVLFGCDPDDPGFRALPRDFAWRHAGVLSRAQTAALLNDVDVFADLSTYQAMGLTALEAMACGAAVIVPQEGGAESFAVHEENALVVDTRSVEACLAAVERLVGDASLRRRLAARGVWRACEFPPEAAAYRVLQVLFPQGRARGWSR
jgi:GT2 family glycosyltransferase